MVAVHKICGLLSRKVYCADNLEVREAHSCYQSRPCLHEDTRQPTIDKHLREKIKLNFVSFLVYRYLAYASSLALPCCMVEAVLCACVTNHKLWVCKHCGFDINLESNLCLLEKVASGSDLASQPAT